MPRTPASLIHAVAAAAIPLGLMPLSEAADGPGVPSIDSTAADYVGHAITNLPAHYQAANVANTNNTPIDNPITNAGAELGRVLFYDARLSHTDGTSCASCHIQENGFGDPNQFSVGVEGGLTGRHSPGLTNAAYYARGRFFWDERAATLEDQVLAPIVDQVEMGSNLASLELELAATDYYPKLFERAFGTPEVTSERMALAMSQFVRSMVSYESKFDQALAAGPPGSVGFRSQLTDQENLGHQIFGQDCARCHGGAAAIATRPENIGLDDNNNDDDGLNGRFKVASLRNIAVREGYMHDGRFATLEEVIEHYSSGIEANPRLSPGLPVGGFGYTDAEEAALVAFLNTMTDQAFLTSDLFSDPFVELAGDYNGDGVVDVDDFRVWRDDFGRIDDNPFAPLMADGNNDGIVNVADFTVWRDNLGAAWDDNWTVVSLVAAPEPGAGLMAALAAVAVVTRRRRWASG